jgi:uncharacterized protein
MVSHWRWPLSSVRSPGGPHGDDAASQWGMRVVIAGGSGFLGRSLAASLGGDGHEVIVLTRRPRSGAGNERPWTPDGAAGPWAAALTGADAVVNLAGEGIADRRWTPARKAALTRSRLDATSSLARAIAAMPSPAAAFLSASGVGYYGPTGDEVVDEQAPAGTDFLGRLAAAWEQATAPAATRTRVVLLRTGLVLGPEGALAKMLLPFRLGVGGRLGSGRQWMPWIHVDDWVGLVRRLLEETRASGPFNLSAPTPVTNAEFTRALGRVLHRPTIMAVPAFALRLALGELSEALLTGQRAVPGRAQALGYTFKHPRVENALAAAVG